MIENSETKIPKRSLKDVFFILTVIILLAGFGLIYVKIKNKNLSPAPQTQASSDINFLTPPPFIPPDIFNFVPGGYPRQIFLNRTVNNPNPSGILGFFTSADSNTTYNSYKDYLTNHSWNIQESGKDPNRTLTAKSNQSDLVFQIKISPVSDSEPKGTIVSINGSSEVN